MLLPDECYNTTRSLVEQGALQKVDENLFRSVGDTVIEVCCADCHERKYWRQYLENFFNYRHVLSLNGGAISISEDSPLNINGEEGRVFLRHIEGAMNLKKTHSIILSVHAPCGLARSNNVSMLEKLSLLLKAADRIRDAFPDANVVKVFHVNYGEAEDRVKNGMKTYVLKRDPFKAYLANQHSMSA